jgi:hypothetical protein
MKMSKIDGKDSLKIREDPFQFQLFAFDLLSELKGYNTRIGSYWEWIPVVCRIFCKRHHETSIHAQNHENAGPRMQS